MYSLQSLLSFPFYLFSTEPFILSFLFISYSFLLFVHKHFIPHFPSIPLRTFYLFLSFPSIYFRTFNLLFFFIPFRTFYSFLFFLSEPFISCFILREFLSFLYSIFSYTPKPIKLKKGFSLSYFPHASFIPETTLKTCSTIQAPP